MMRLWDIAPNRGKGAVKDDLSFLGIILVKFKPLCVSDEDGNRLINFYKTHTPEAIREMKREARCLTRFGAKNNSCTVAWREQTEKAHISRFGSHSAYVSHMVAARSATCNARYGGDVNSLPEKKAAAAATNMEKYGSLYHPRPSSHNARGQILHWAAWRENHPDLVCLKDLAEILCRDRRTLYSVLRLHNFETRMVDGQRCISASILPDVKAVLFCGKYIQASRSEKEVVTYIKSIFPGEVLENVKNVIPPKELDIYIPSKKLAIEYNGLAWHSDRPRDGRGIPDVEARRNAKWRHLEKVISCEKAGVRLIHIFEDDWLYRSDIVKSILRNALGFSAAIPARKCTIAPISFSDYSVFLQSNHLLGPSPADIRIGLFYLGELVELIGIKSCGNHIAGPELVRLATKCGMHVQGGFSRLLQHVRKNFPKCFPLTSYIDRGSFCGNGYAACGFVRVCENEPTYFYVKGQVRYPRYKFMRKDIRRMHQSGELPYWNPCETEELNMYKNGYHRIWNSGTIKVVLSK